MARRSVVPMMTRLGFMKSPTASPSFRNSGFAATTQSWRVCSRTTASILSPVRTGTDHVARDQLFESRFIDRQREARAGHEADVAGPDHAHFHDAGGRG